MLAKNGVRPDKSLGQHFLVSEGVVGKIVARASGLAGVLEVGPGPGVLTGPMTREGIVVTAVEVDTTILPVLAEMAPEAAVVVGDALKVGLRELLEALPEPRGIVSNMPYNITGPLLEKFTECRPFLSKAVLMMQREVAEKILAPPGDRRRGALSVSVQARFHVTRVCHVPPGAFLPPPKVDSTVLELVPTVDVRGDIEDMMKLVRAGFTQPRKTLLNNLAGAFGIEQTRSRIVNAGLDERVRPHQLTWEQWLKVLS